MTRYWPHIVSIVVSVTVSSLLARAAIVSPGNPTSVPTGSSVLISSGTCPSGFVEDTTFRGRFIVGAPSGGTVGGTLGSAAADLADASYTPAGSTTTSASAWGNTTSGSATTTGTMVTFPLTGPLCNSIANGGCATVSQGFSLIGTANTTMRSTVAPYIQVQVCKKS